MRYTMSATALCALLAAAPAVADTYLAATWLGLGSPNGKFMQEYAAQIDEISGGELTFDLHAGGALLPADGSLSGLSANVAQFVHITGAYVPSDLPLDNVMSDFAFAYEGSLTALAIGSIETKLTDPSIQEEYKSHDAVFVSTGANGPYNLICKGEIRGLDDLDGKKIRVTSSAHVAWLNAVGATSVSVPGSEIYTGLQRNSIDCAVGDPLFLTDYFNLVEVADSVTTLSLGWLDTGGYFFNRDFWNDITPEERRQLLDAAAMTTAVNMIEWEESLEGAYAAADEQGVAVIEPGEDLAAQMDAYKAEYRDGFAAFEMDKRKIDDPGELVAHADEAHDRWNALLSEIDARDPEALAALLKTEIYDKIDVETYGID